MSLVCRVNQEECFETSNASPRVINVALGGFDPRYLTNLSAGTKQLSDITVALQFLLEQLFLGTGAGARAKTLLRSTDTKLQP